MAEQDLGVDHSTIARWVLRYSPEVNKPISREIRRQTGPGEWMRRMFESWTLDLPPMLSPNRTGEIRPRVIDVDLHSAYPRRTHKVIADLKRAGELKRNCRRRPAPYLNKHHRAESALN